MVVGGVYELPQYLAATSKRLFGDNRGQPADVTSAVGQSRHFGRRQTTSGLPPEADIVKAGRHVSKVPILLQKSFSGEERKFWRLLMRFACGDVRDLIVSHKNDHGPSHRRYRALQQ
jgi:hypothetical protein